MRSLRQPARGRRREGGQVAILATLMAVLLFGVTALAIDLGVQTTDQRHLQNAADSAALAGAEDIPADGSCSSEKQAVEDALATAGTNLGWGAGWFSGSITCSTPATGVPQTSVTAANGSYTVGVSSPPRTPNNTARYTTVDYIEVDIHQAVGNPFAAVIGLPTSLVAAHAVAYHYGPHGPADYALYATTEITSGNQAQAVIGDAYVGQGYIPQSSGQAGICAYEYTLPNGTVAGGHLIYGYPQPPSPVPSKMPEPQVITYGYGGSCPGGGALTAQQPAGDCPAGIYWETITATSPSEQLCVADPPSTPPVTDEPNVGGLIPPATLPRCTIDGTWTSVAANQGVYDVPSGACPSNTVTIDYAKGDISCLSLVLESGVTVSLQNGPTPPATGPPPVEWTAYGVSGCPGYSTSGTPSGTADLSAVWSASKVSATLTDGTGGCCHDYGISGSVEMPGGTIAISKNSTIGIDGQAVAGTWNIQSGNHPNPLVDYNPDNTPVIVESLQLVE
jgi:Flp pilus assembly protein TadG